MNRIKELLEKRGAKAQEARAIFNKATAEKRELSADERTKIDALQKECEDLDANAQIEIRQLALEARKTPYEDLSTSEKRDLDTFDLGKAIRSLVYGEALDGIEKEMVDSGRAEARTAGIKSAGGIILPQMLVHRSAVGPREKRILSATGGTELQYGGGLIQTTKMGILDAFFDALVLREAGALILTGLQGNFDWPSYVAPSAFAHKTENQDAGEGSPSFSDVAFSPKRLPGFIDLSDQLLMQTGSVVEQVVRQNLISQLAAQAEYFAIHGTGLNGQPKGILATVGIGDVAMGTNGAIPTWAKVVALETKIAVQNAARAEELQQVVDLRTRRRDRLPGERVDRQLLVAVVEVRRTVDQRATDRRSRDVPGVELDQWGRDVRAGEPSGVQVPDRPLDLGSTKLSAVPPQRVRPGLPRQGKHVARWRGVNTIGELEDDRCSAPREVDNQPPRRVVDRCAYKGEVRAHAVGSTPSITFAL